MLIHNTAVLYRHVPTTELHELCSHCTMLLIEWCAFQRGCVVCCHFSSLQCDDMGMTCICLTISYFGGRRRVGECPEQPQRTGWGMPHPVRCGCSGVCGQRD